MTFGQYVKQMRRQAGLTLREMTALMLKEDGTPISNQYLSDVELGRRDPLSNHLIEELVRALKSRVPEVSADIFYFKGWKNPT